MRFSKHLAAALLIAAGLSAAPAMALITSDTGNKPVADHNWPGGAVDVADLATRLGWFEGPPFGGVNFRFLYHGDGAACQRALDLFARIKSPKLQLFVHDGGPATTSMLSDGSGQDAVYDWSFDLWTPENWRALHNDSQKRSTAGDPGGGYGQAVPPPRIDVFVGGNGIEFSTVTVPAGIDVTDNRADAHGYHDGSAVVGDLSDFETPGPIVGAKISLVSPSNLPAATGLTDVNGHFALTKATAGAFRVIATADHYAPRQLGRIELHGNTDHHYAVGLSIAVTVTGTALDMQTSR